MKDNVIIKNEDKEEQCLKNCTLFEQDEYFSDNVNSELAILYMIDLAIKSARANLKAYEESGMGVKINLVQCPNIIINGITKNIINYAVVCRKGNVVNYCVYDGVKHLSNFRESSLEMLYVTENNERYIYFLEGRDLKYFPEVPIDRSNIYDFANIYIRTEGYHLLINLQYLHNKMQYVTSTVTEDIDGVFYKQLIDNMISIAISPNNFQKPEIMRSITSAQ